MDASAVLLTPVSLGLLELPNRIVMSPLTRCRAEPDGGLATPMMAEYYAQRAGAGLIVSEGIPVCPMGVGYAGVSGLWTRAQADCWRRVTDAVHWAGGRIVAQLWHVGRLSDPVFLDGRTPVAPSAVPPQGTVTRIRPKRPWVTPHALSISGIAEVVDAFGHAARMARAAGFDGVELHGANGYLFDQFLQSSANRREDAYGGPPANRMRLLLETLDAITCEWPPGRVGVHLSPRSGHSVSDPDPHGLFSAIAEALDARALAFVYLREAPALDNVAPAVRARFRGGLVLNEKLTVEAAADLVATGRADAVGFGKLFIANPDLVARIAAGAALAEPDPTGYYEGGAIGYTDYPTMRAEAR